ncbi:ATP-binding protein [Nitrincola sp. MINF-07-Sa-05]|uniref:ATP-binding protein n=1 Tax=Nitrincola salilacus TaxID=3400273 RepID=UPI0039185C52
MILITLILGGYFTYIQISDAKSTLLTKGHELSRLLATSAEFGILSGNTDLLSPLSQRLLQDPHISDVIFMDTDRRLLHREANFPLELNQALGGTKLINDIWYFIMPVESDPIQLMDHADQEQDEENREIVGWVGILISDQPIIERQRQIIWRSLLLSCIGLITTFMIASRIGNGITRPIAGLSAVIKLLQKGNFSIRATSTSTHELDILAKGINNLAATIEISNRELERRVELATRQLSKTIKQIENKNFELTTARNKADDANRAKDEFLARMSHELRTPLTSVIGFTQMMSQENSLEQQKQYLQIIDQTSLLLLNIIDDILDFSRLESNAIKLECIPFDLCAAIQEVINMLAPLAQQKGLEIIHIYDPSLPTLINGDPTRFRQIISNLINNAIKFTDSGHVFIRATHSEQDNNQLHLEVNDTGIGIAEHHKPYLFNAFSQADSSISREYGGSGLGLAIVYRLVTLMQGNILLESEESKGTHITINLPLQSAQDSRELKDELQAAIAVYDSYPEMTQALAEQLQMAGASVTIFNSMSDLLFSNKTYTHILVGISPTMTLSEVRNLQKKLSIRFANKKILLLTPPHQMQQAASKDFINLSKPTNPQTLLQIIADRQRVVAYEEMKLQPLPVSLHVLVVEDNELNRMLVTRILTELGASVTTANCGEEAIEIVKQKLPDLVLMDVNMPGMDGITATRHLKAHFPELKIVALTANIAAREQKALRDTGVAEILLKPIKIPELQRLLCEFDPANTAHISASPYQASFPSVKSFAFANRLNDEVKRQLDAILELLLSDKIDKIRAHTHQLIGLAGLYEEPELESCVFELHDSITRGSKREIWKYYYRMRRALHNRS